MSCRVSTRPSAMVRMSRGREGGTVGAQASTSSRVLAVTEARFSSPIRGARAFSLSREPWQSGQTDATRNRSTRARRLSVSARLSSSSTVRRALRKVKSRSWTPFFEAKVMCFFSSGPSRTISRSQSSRSRHGTSVRTPNSRAMVGWTLKPNICQGTTAPSSRVLDASTTRVASSTVRTVPVPSQVGHAPSALKASCSAPGACTSSPQTGQVKGTSAATSMVGGTRCPRGHRCEARRENISRGTFSGSLEVPKVERTEGTPGRWRRASAAGTCSTESTAARGAWAMRRRV